MKNFLAVVCLMFTSFTALANSQIRIEGQISANADERSLILTKPFQIDINLINSGNGASVGTQSNGSHFMSLDSIGYLQSGSGRCIGSTDVALNLKVNSNQVGQDPTKYSLTIYFSSLTEENAAQDLFAKNSLANKYSSVRMSGLEADRGILFSGAIAHSSQGFNILKQLPGCNKVFKQSKVTITVTKVTILN